MPAPLTQRHTHADLTEWFAASASPAGFHRVGIAHGSVQGILAEGIDSSNPIAAGRAEQAGLDYLALGDWHGTKQVDARTWYSGTPETDRFRANQSGQALRVELAGAGALPVVTAVETGQYRWQSDTTNLQVPTDLDSLLQRLAQLEALDVLDLAVSGQTDLAGHRRLAAALGQARGRVRGLLVDLAALRLEPTADDIDTLNADGYLGDVLAELRSGQQSDEAEISRDALALLAGLLDERRRNSDGRAAPP